MQPTQVTQSDDDYVGTQPDRSARQWRQLPDDVRELMVAAVVRLFLFKEALKQPVRRKDVLDAIGPNYKEARVRTAVLDEAKARLRSVFGYDVIVARKDAYILRSKFTPAVLGASLRALPTETSERVHRERGLLLTTLSLVFIAQGKITQDMLFLQLKQLGLGEPDKTAWWVVALTRTFPAQLYLVRTKEGDNRITYELGERAVHEIGKRALLEHIAATLGQEVDANRLQEIEAELNEGGNDAEPNEAPEPIAIEPEPTQTPPQRALRRRLKHK